MKEKLMSTLGVFGLILYYVYSLFTAFFPLWFLNLPTWAFFLLVILFQFVPMLCPIAWVVGLFFVIKAPQTTLSLVYYVLFALIVLKTFIGVFKSR
jgi:hypothetical protein|nr:MAG TPA: hypothetical protein [Caudoviricetes sp.]